MSGIRKEGEKRDEGDVIQEVMCETGVYGVWMPGKYQQKET